MTPRNEVPMQMESHENQQQYVDDQKKIGAGFSLIAIEAFLRGMRDIGYKSHGWALAEMIDNSIQAGAERWPPIPE